MERIPSLSETVVELKGDIEHLNVKMEKMNEKLEVSFAMGRCELNEGFQNTVKMFKGMSLDPSMMTGEGSRMKSTSFVEKQFDSEPITPEKITAASAEGSYRKLELPSFNGIDPDAWIFRAERYFSMSNLSDEERAVAAGVCMEGNTLSWFQWEDGRRPIRSWTILKQCLLERFRNTQYGTMHHRFLAIKQTGIVAEFREKIKIMLAPLKNVSEETLERVFINGLKEEVQAEVLMANSIGLSQIMDMTQ